MMTLTAGAERTPIHCSAVLPIGLLHFLTTPRLRTPQSPIAHLLVGKVTLYRKQCDTREFQQ